MQLFLIVLFASVLLQSALANDNVPVQKEGLSGHTDRFLTIVYQELIPFVEKHYRAALVRLLSGRSFGGVFVIYSQLEWPSLFGLAIQIFLSQQSLDDATQIAELYASYYPSSPTARYRLASALAPGGKMARAIDAADTAIHLYDKSPSPKLNEFHSSAKQLRQKLISVENQ